jgi:tryptophanyl-tRNA synthetase
LLDAAGEQLLLSVAFADGKSAGMVNKRLQSGDELDVRQHNSGFAVWLDDAAVAHSPDFADSASCESAIARLREALQGE